MKIYNLLFLLIVFESCQQRNTDSTNNNKLHIVDSLRADSIRLDKIRNLKLLTPMVNPKQSVDLSRTDFTIPGISLGIVTVPNLRDLGGYTTRDGRVTKSNLLYRSNELAKISKEDMASIASLNLVNDFDFRTQEERRAVPDQIPQGVKNIWLNVLADNSSSSAASLNNLFLNPELINKKLGNGKALESFLDVYKQLVSSESALKSYSQFFHTILDEKQLPSLFHCTTGKDRTGWAAASLLTLLGISKEQVYYDYLQTNNYILPKYSKDRAYFIKSGGDPSIIDVILQVRSEYLDTAFKEMEDKYGTIENYFEKGLGINKNEQEKLKDIFLSK